MKFHISDDWILKFEKAFGIAGLFIVAWMVYRLGPQRVAQNLHTVSWGFLAMVAIAGIRYLCETASWRLILAQEGRKIGLLKLYKTVLQGEALNYITFTRVGGEPLKALAIRAASSLSFTAASVIVLKFCTLFGFWIVISGGFLAIFFHAGASPNVRFWAGIGLAAIGFFLASFSWIQKVGLFKPLAWALKKLETEREWVSHQVLRLARLDEHIIETYRSKPWRIFFAILVSAAGWAEVIVFVWTALYFLNLHETWFLPTMIATLSMLLSSFFFFVPWKAGTQEGTMVLTFSILDLSEPMGLSVAILRRVAEIFWVFLGLALFALETLNAPGTNAPEARRETKA